MIADYKGEYLIIGPPGCGKTTRLARSVRRICDLADYAPRSNRSPVLLCSLTKTAAQEIAGHDLPLPRQAIGTLHSHAFHAIGAPELAESKDSLTAWNALKPNWRITTTIDAETGPEAQAEENAPGNAMLAEMHVLRARMTPEKAWPFMLQQFMRDWTTFKRANEMIDFSDMIELACETSPPCHAEIIIADEAQDLSRLERKLLTAWGEQAGAMILCGDPWQALYEWRGADHRILLEENFDPKQIDVLRQSYRVPKSLVRMAQKLAREFSDWHPIEYAATDQEGRILTSPATYRYTAPLLEPLERAIDRGESVMILATCEYMLPDILKTLREAAIPFANPWRVKHGGWNPLARRKHPLWERMLFFLKKNRQTWGHQARQWTYEEFKLWADPLTAKGTFQRGKKVALERLTDPSESIREPEFRELAEYLEIDPTLTLEDLCAAANAEGATVAQTRAMLTWWISRLPTPKQNSIRYAAEIVLREGAEGLLQRPIIYVGTIHSFKGAEADHVILFPDLSPSSIRQWQSGPDGRDAIIRMFYVALTRAKQTLTICNPGGPMHVPLHKYIC